MSRFLSTSTASRAVYLPLRVGAADASISVSKGVALPMKCHYQLDPNDRRQLSVADPPPHSNPLRAEVNDLPVVSKQVVEATRDCLVIGSG